MVLYWTVNIIFFPVLNAILCTQTKTELIKFLKKVINAMYSAS